MNSNTVLTHSHESVDTLFFTSDWNGVFYCKILEAAFPKEKGEPVLKGNFINFS